MKVTPMGIEGLLLLEPRCHGDDRGWFMETWQVQRYADVGVPDRFVQDNLARSAQGVLRGLHAQHPFAQGKLVQVYEGRVFDVAVDVRRGSPSFGRWAGVILDAAEPRQFWVPAGFLHGYLVLSESALFGYKCTDLYHPETQFSVRWDDPVIGVEWPLEQAPLLSEKDREAPLLADLDRGRLPAFEG